MAIQGRMSGAGRSVTPLLGDQVVACLVVAVDLYRPDSTVEDCPGSDPFKLPRRHVKDRERALSQDRLVTLLAASRTVAEGHEPIVPKPRVVSSLKRRNSASKFGASIEHAPQPPDRPSLKQGQGRLASRLIQPLLIRDLIRRVRRVDVRSWDNVGSCRRATLDASSRVGTKLGLARLSRR